MLNKRFNTSYMGGFMNWETLTRSREALLFKIGLVRTAF